MTALAVVAGPGERAQEALAAVRDRYALVDLDDAEAVVVLGGDGSLIDVLHDLLDRGGDLPAVMGLNRGTTGFLLNEYSPHDLPDRVAAAVETVLHPLRVDVESPDGEVTTRLACNEVALRRAGSQVARLAVWVDGEQRLDDLKGDGVMVATPAGSTGYSSAAGGPVLPLDSGLLALTPVCALRPRRWRGALLPRTSTVRVEVLEAEKRPVATSPDQRGLVPTASAVVTEDRERRLRLLFDVGRGLEERYVAEQFEV